MVRIVVKMKSKKLTMGGREKGNLVRKLCRKGSRADGEMVSTGENGDSIGKDTRFLRRVLATGPLKHGHLYLNSVPLMEGET